MTQELAGKVAVITGGAGGIGRATAELFVAAGAKVVIADRDTAAGEALAQSLGEAALFLETDVASAADVQAAVDAAVESFGGLHIMFNNAGISCGAYPQFVDDRLDDFQRVMGVNVYGPMVGTQAAARHMKDHGGGVVLQTSSIAGIVAGYAMMTYRASKAALIHFSKSAAIDLAQYDIRVNCIVPGHIRTPLSSFGESGIDADTAARLAEKIDAVYLSNQPLKRRGEPKDVAEVALFLASDRARQMTGLVLPVEMGVAVGDPVNHLQDIFDARASVLGA